MKKFNFFLTGMVVLGLCGSVYADDNMNTQTPTMVEYTEKYTGFDINLGAGYAAITNKLSFSNRTQNSSTKLGADGVSAQLKIGGNYGFSERWLVGLEAYGQYNNAKIEHGYIYVPDNIRASKSFTIHWNLGLDLRLGVAFAPSNLIFVYGGPDWAHHKFQYTTVGLDETHTKFKIGGVFGAGTEQMFTDNWVMRLTFDYRWYPSQTYHHANGETHTLKSKMATTMFMVGYKF